MKARKLDLYQSVYCYESAKFSGGKLDCDHDYDEKPIEETDTFARWKCTRCGGVLTIEVWD